MHRLGYNSDSEEYVCADCGVSVHVDIIESEVISVAHRGSGDPDADYEEPDYDGAREQVLGGWDDGVGCDRDLRDVKIVLDE